MEKKFDLISLLKAIHYETCNVYVATEEQYANDDWEEISGDEDLYDMLTDLDADGVEYIHANYKYVTWHYCDRFIPQLRIEYGVDDDSLHFRYDRFNLKTKYTLINILKSQSEWHHIGIAMYDNGTEEIVADSWFDEYDTEDDTWIHAFEDLCDEWEVNSRHASLFKAQEEEDGKTIDILDIVIDTETYKRDDEEDTDDEDDEELAIGSREEMVGVPLAGIPFYDFDLRITPEEAEKLDGEVEVAFYTGGPYFSSRDAAVKWTGALKVDNLTLNLYSPLYDYHDALYRLWEENDYGHNFKDFVIEVFDMKIKKGKVAILIELGS